MLQIHHPDGSNEGGAPEFRANVGEAGLVNAFARTLEDLLTKSSTIALGTPAWSINTQIKEWDNAVVAAIPPSSPTLRQFIPDNQSPSERSSPIADSVRGDEGKRVFALEQVTERQVRWNALLTECVRFLQSRGNVPSAHLTLGEQETSRLEGLRLMLVGEHTTALNDGCWIRKVQDFQSELRASALLSQPHAVNLLNTPPADVETMIRLHWEGVLLERLLRERDQAPEKARLPRGVSMPEDLADLALATQPSPRRELGHAAQVQLERYNTLLGVPASPPHDPRNEPTTNAVIRQPGEFERTRDFLTLTSRFVMVLKPDQPWQPGVVSFNFGNTKHESSSGQPITPLIRVNQELLSPAQLERGFVRVRPLTSNELISVKESMSWKQRIWDEPKREREFLKQRERISTVMGYSDAVNGDTYLNKRLEDHVYSRSKMTYTPNRSFTAGYEEKLYHPHGSLSTPDGRYQSMTSAIEHYLPGGGFCPRQAHSWAITLFDVAQDRVVVHFEAPPGWSTPETHRISAIPSSVPHGKVTFHLHYTSRGSFGESTLELPSL